MSVYIVRSVALAGLFAFGAQASCTPDLMLIGQTSWRQKQPSLWRVEGREPYQRQNIFHNAALSLGGRCTFFADRLSLDSAIWGETYTDWRTPGDFERDERHSRLLIDKLQFSWSLTDTLRADAGKLRSDGGNFYFYSPASLLRNYDGGFKANRIYAEGVAPVYQGSFWGATLSQIVQRHTLSFTAAPALTRTPARYRSADSWPDLARSNATGRYLLNWTSYADEGRTFSASAMAGDSAALALSTRYTPEGAWAFSAEMALNADRQWRHLDKESVRRLQAGEFPSQLYSTGHARNIELAVGTEYTTASFSQFGLEYYFQSAGYSSGEWHEQTELMKSLRYAGEGSFFGPIFDVYKSLMAAEIYNVSAQGHLTGKHYATAWASLAFADRGKLQPWGVFNMRDASALLGLRYSKPLAVGNHSVELYTGAFVATGSKDSEFALFGESLGTYLGFKYHF